MVSDDQNGFEQRLEELRRKYIESLPAKIDDIVDAVAAATEGRDELTALFTLAHTIAGSAPTFGLREVGDAAADMETAAEARLSSPGEAKNQPWPEIEGLLKKFRAVAAKALAGTRGG